MGSNMLGYLESQGIIEELLERQLDAIADFGAQHVRDQLDASLLSLTAIASGNEFLAAGLTGVAGGAASAMAEVASPPAVQDYLERKRKELGGFETLRVQDMEGSVFAAAGSTVTTADCGEGSIRQLDGTKIAVSRTPRDMAPPGFSLCVPLKTGHGQQVGHLVGVLGERGLGEFLKIPPHAAGSIESFVVDDAGRPLFVSHIHGELDFSSPLASAVLSPSSRSESSSEAFARYANLEGTPVVGTSVGIENTPWQYLAEFPVADALGPLRFLRRVSIIFGTALAVALVISAWFVAGGIVAPVRHLVAATREVGGGSLDVQVDVATQDEVGELGSAFNEMTRRLVETSEEVKKLHQAEIERAQQLATVGELASGVAHEIKNPVVGISNGLDLVKKRIGNDESLAPITDEMTRQLKRIEQAVTDLLTFARPAVPALAPADANHVVQRAVTLVQPAAERAGVSLTLNLTSEPVDLLVDPELVRQGIVNLLMNAIQATAPGGMVAIATEHRDGAVVIEVADTGRGIPGDSVAEIFKPFYTTRHSGTGLGLSISREIVERHGGRIEVTSEPERGSKFVIRLPDRRSSPGDSRWPKSDVR
jgi:signal transduction histidine kinase